MPRRSSRPLLAVALGSALAITLSACGSSGDDVKGASDSTSAPASEPSSPDTKPVKATPCAVADLNGSVKMGGAAAGTAYYTIVLTNAGSSACVLRGFGTVALQDAAGEQVGSAARHDASQGHPKRIVLQPGGAASQRLGVATAANYPSADCVPAKAAGLRVTPPHQRSAVTVDFKADGCTSTSVKLLTVQPYQSVK